MGSQPPVLDVEGPLQAELFVVWLDGHQLALTGPCGAAPWLIELADPEHPVEAVARIVRDVLGEPRLVHSTSWRRAHDAVILTFIVVVDATLVAGLASAPLVRADLARGGSTSGPREVSFAQVVEHGLRHLAWLAGDDPAVAAELPSPWRAALASYVPEPFRSLG